MISQMKFSSIAMGFVFLLCQPLLGAERGEIKPVETWLGEISLQEAAADPNRNLALQQLTTVRLINDDKIWALAWKALKPEDDKLPEVDFQENLVFISLTPKMDAPMTLKLLHDGQGNVTSLLAATASAFNAGYAIVVFPREGVKTFEERPIPKPPKKVVVKKAAPDAPRDAEDAKPVEAEFRTWTSKDQKFTLEAKFIQFKAGQVHLERKDDNKIIEIASSKLSLDDQKYIREFLKGR